MNPNLEGSNNFDNKVLDSITQRFFRAKWIPGFR